MENRAVQIPHFEVEREIGQGAMSVVYRAMRGGKAFAVKVMRDAETGNSLDATLRFRREAAALARLSNPGLVKVLEAGESDGRPYLVMELVEGEELSSVLQRGALESSVLLRYAKALASALAEVHRRGLIHRDVKPSNIVIDATGAPKLIDFGFVAAAADLMQVRQEVVGTLLYAAPEQTGMLKRPVDGRADLYALGAVLFECAAARPPFQAPTTGELMRLHAAVRAPDVRDFASEVSPALAAIIAKLLAKDPDDRYQTGEGLLADLQTLPELEAIIRSGQKLSLGESDVRIGAVGDVPMVGREAELATLERAWTKATSGKGTALLVEGEGGSGKTRLIRELLRQARQAGALVLTCKCQEADHVPFGPLREAVDDYVSRVLRLRNGEKEAAIEKLRRAAGEYAPLVRRLSRGLEVVLKESTGSGVQPDQERFYSAIADFFIQLAREHGPTVLLLDDVQWMDEASQQVLVRLAARLEGAPLLIAGTSRNDAASEKARAQRVGQLGAALSVRLVLSPLGVPAVGQLVAAHLGGHELERGFVERLASRTNGNPFAIGEYVRALLDSGAIRPAAGIWQVDHDRLAELALPTDVLQLVTSRAAALSPDTAHLLSSAAVVGMNFSRLLVARVTSASDEVLSQALTEAERASLIERAESGTEQFSFVHDRVREALVAKLSPEELKDVHQRVAEELDKDTHTVGPGQVFSLAQHYAHGHPERNPQRYFEVCRTAGQQALAAYANQEALEFLTRARAVAEGLSLSREELGELSSALGQACFRTARLKDAAAHFERALSLTEDSLVRAQLHVHLCRIHVIEFNWPGVEAQSYKALEAAGQTFPKSGVMRYVSTAWMWFIALVMTSLGLGYGTASGDALPRLKLLAELYALWAFSAWSFRTRFSTVLLPRLLYVAHRLGARRESIEPLAMFTIVGAVRFPQRAIQFGQRGVRLAEQLGDPALLAYARRNLAWAHQFSGDWRTGEQMGRENLLKYGKWLHPRDFASLCTLLSCNLLTRGLARETVEVQKAGLEVSDRAQIPSGMSTVRAPLAAAEAVLGQMADAVRHTEEEREIRSTRVSVNDPHTLAFSAEWAVLTCLEQDDLGAPLEQAIARRESLGRHILDWPEYQTHFYIFVAYARLRQFRKAQGADRINARAVLERAMSELEMLAHEPLKRSHAVMIRAALERDVGDVRVARRLLREAERLALLVDNRLVLFEVALERARDALVQGDEMIARREAEVAMDLAVKQGWRNRGRAVRSEFKLQDQRAQDTSTNLSANGHSSGTKGYISERYLNALLRASLASSSTLEPTEQARAALDEIVRLLGAERAFLFLCQGEVQDLELQVGRDAKGCDLPGATGYSKTVVNKVAQTRQPLVVTGTEEGALLGSESAVANELRSIIAAPLMLREKLIGVVYLDNRLVKGLFTSDDVDILLAIANHIAIAVETARAARLEIERKELELKRRDLERDMELTAAVQSLFLPKQPSCQSEGIGLHGFYRPAGKCSGDWWWYEVPTPGTLLVLIGDTTGHGAAPAMVTAAVAAGFRVSRSLARERALPDTLRELSQQLLEISAGQYTMTLSAVHLDSRTRTLRYWSAGAPPLLVLRMGGKVESLACAGTPLGSDCFEVGWREVGLMAGDRIFSFTDGLSELELPSGRQFGMRRLSNLFIQTRGLSLEAATQRIVEELDLARGDIPQGDDLTFALLEVQP